MSDDHPQILKTYKIRGYDVSLLQDYKTYPLAMTICKSGERDTVATVTLERNRMARALKMGSHFLCMHDGDRHLNYGASDEYMSIDKFEDAALKIIENWIDCR